MVFTMSIEHVFSFIVMNRVSLIGYIIYRIPTKNVIMQSIL